MGRVRPRHQTPEHAQIGLTESAERARRSLTIDVRAVPVSGPVIHGHERHGHDHAGWDLTGAGSKNLGQLSYSILRSQGINMRRARKRRVDAVLSEMTDLRRLWDRVAKVEKAEAEKIHRQRTKLLVWDLIREVGETCEQLAAMFTAVTEWDKSSIDLATTLIEWQGSAYDVFAQSGFEDLDWWNRILGTEPASDRLAAITPRQAEIVRDLFASAAKRLPSALGAVREIYTKELHRIFVRRKHLAPLLDADWGLVFESEDAALAEWVRGEVADGALVLADHKVVRGRIVQLVIPTTQETVDSLWTLWSDADWLSESLAGAVLSRAEHPAGLPIAMDEHSYDIVDVMTAIYAYSGSPPDVLEADLAVEAHSRAVHSAAREHDASIAQPNRAGRRAAAKADRKRRRPERT
jgi:hypothetical protein